MSCRICLEDTGILVSPCGCKGTAGYVHEKCLNKWIRTSKAKHCEICHEDFCREEVCAFRPLHYTKAFFACYAHSQIGKKICFRVGYAMFIITMFMLLYIPPEHLILFNTICTFFTISLTTLCQLLVYIHYQEELEVYNILMVLKLCFSAPYAFMTIVNHVYFQSTCEAACDSIDLLCGEACPYYAEYSTKTTFMQYALMFDVLNICIFTVLRMGVLCFSHMRKSKFIDRLDEEELLLDHRDRLRTENLSGAASTSSDSLSAEASSSSAAMLPPATNVNMVSSKYTTRLAMA